MQNTIEILKELFHTKLMTINLTESCKKKLKNDKNLISKNAQKQIIIRINNEPINSVKFLFNKENQTKLTENSILLG